jgi:hypothetical protein
MDIRLQLIQQLSSLIGQQKNNISQSSALSLHSIQRTDQFLAARPDLMQQLGAYHPAQIDEKNKQLFNHQIQELAKFINFESGSNLPLLMQRTQQDAYLSSLLIQSFGWIRKHIIQEEQKKRRFQKSPHEPEIEQIENSTEESVMKDFIESLLFHAENSSKPDDFLFWARQSIEVSIQQMKARGISLSENSQKMMEIASKTLEAIQNGSSIEEIRSLLDAN